MGLGTAEQGGRAAGYVAIPDLTPGPKRRSIEPLLYLPGRAAYALRVLLERGMKVLVTGGFGFIGSHLVDGLIEAGHQVRVFDNLEPQVHGGRLPDYANPQAEYLVGDMLDRERLGAALAGVEAVFHQAAMVGVGQSMYRMERYVSANCVGTALLLELLARERGLVNKLVVASSMSIYGEGSYACPRCGESEAGERSREQLRQRIWEPLCPHCGGELEARPTKEEKRLEPGSIYAVTKRDQEELCLAFGRAYDLPTVALRYFNAYGPRQSLSNPYTGVCAIFSSRLKNGQPPLIFEDGGQRRDFIHVSDLVQANLLALDRSGFDYQALNVGTGEPVSILELAGLINEESGGRGLEPIIQGRFRAGDIRHCYADITRIKALGFEPRMNIREGIRELLAWTEEAPALDKVPQALAELEKRKLVK